MVFLPKFSLLSLSQPANTKQGEQYKNYKIFTHIQTLHDNGYKSTKITVWKSWLDLSVSYEASSPNVIGKMFLWINNAVIGLPKTQRPQPYESDYNTGG